MTAEIVGQPEPIAVPTDCWYALGPAAQVGRSLAALRLAGRPLVAFRTTQGAAVVLEDRCAHRPYPLSAGTLDGDTVRCGLCGFVYDATGQCISVPTQPRVPFGAYVRAYPTSESDGIVWVWLGEPGRATLHRVPELGWLGDPAWVSVSGTTAVAANFLLLHENFADVTQVPFVAPEISPQVLAAPPPPLDVIVSETSVALHRHFDPAPLPAWQAVMAGVSADAPYATFQEAYLTTPAVWVDHWDAQAADGSWLRLRFTQLVTPIDNRSSRLTWAVSRDFALADAGATAQLQAMFTDYYSRVIATIETQQALIDYDGAGREVNVSSDVAALKVREIVSKLLIEEGLSL